MDTVTDSLLAERRAFVATLTAVGPDAPTVCSAWTTTDLAVHVALGEAAAGLVSAPARLLVGRGVRVDRVAALNRAVLAAIRRRRGFDWALHRLSRPAPRVQQVRSLAAVSLLEVWAHHEDILDAHGHETCASGADLTPIMPVLIRYQHAMLAERHVCVRTGDHSWFAPRTPAGPETEVDVEVDGSIAVVARWLSGRGTLDALSVSGPPAACADLLSAAVTI